MVVHWVALLPNGFNPELRFLSVLSSACSSHVHIPATVQKKHATKWIVYDKLHIGVNVCVCMVPSDGMVIKCHLIV